jgi:hypothetical protein
MLNSRAVCRGVLFGAALAAFPITRARAQFEGTITMQPSSSANAMEYSIKGDRLRIDVNSGNTKMGSVYMLATNGKMQMVMPAMHMYMDPPVSTGQAAIDARAKTKTSIKATGRMETIAGYQCEHYTITGGDGQYDACLSKQLGTFMAPMSPMGARGRGAASGDVLDMLGGNAFPLKIQKVGGETSFEVTKIEKKSLDDSMFSVPSDYRKVDLSAMGRPPAN